MDEAMKAYAIIKESWRIAAPFMKLEKLTDQDWDNFVYIGQTECEKLRNDDPDLYALYSAIMRGLQDYKGKCEVLKNGWN